jgi:hypothetical protein
MADYAVVICRQASIVHFFLACAFPFFYRNITRRHTVRLWGGPPVIPLAQPLPRPYGPPLLR